MGQDWRPSQRVGNNLLCVDLPPPLLTFSTINPVAVLSLTQRQTSVKTLSNVCSVMLDYIYINTYSITSQGGAIKMHSIAMQAWGLSWLSFVFPATSNACSPGTFEAHWLWSLVPTHGTWAFPATPAWRWPFPFQDRKTQSWLMATTLLTMTSASSMLYLWLQLCPQCLLPLYWVNVWPHTLVWCWMLRPFPNLVSPNEPSFRLCLLISRDPSETCKVLFHPRKKNGKPRKIVVFLIN